MYLLDIILELKIYLGEKSATKTTKNIILKIIFIIIKMELKKTALPKTSIQTITAIITIKILDLIQMIKKAKERDSTLRL